MAYETVPPFIPRFDTWQDLPEAADETTAGEDMVLRATDINRIQNQLRLLTDGVNANSASITTTNSGIGVLTGAHAKGSMMVHNGTQWTTREDGGYGQVLTPDATHASGASWLRPHPNSLYTGEEVTINANQPVVSQWGSTGGTEYNGETQASFYATPGLVTAWNNSYYNYPVTLYKTIDGWVCAKFAGTLSRVLYRGGSSFGNVARVNYGVIIPPGFRPAVNTVVDPSRHRSANAAFAYSSNIPLATSQEAFEVYGADNNGLVNGTYAKAGTYYSWDGKRNPDEPSKNHVSASAPRLLVSAAGHVMLHISNSGGSDISFTCSFLQDVKMWKAA